MPIAACIGCHGSENKPRISRCVLLCAGVGQQGDAVTRRNCLKFWLTCLCCHVQVLGDKELPRTAAGLEALQEFVDTVKILVDAQGQVLQNFSPEAKQEVSFSKFALQVKQLRLWKS